MKYLHKGNMPCMKCLELPKDETKKVDMSWERMKYKIKQWGKGDK